MLTMVNLCGLIPDMSCCLELFGFDIMVDQQLKPWLLEVNSAPALSLDGPIDQKVKPSMVRDLIDLVNFEPPEDYFVTPFMPLTVRKGRRSQGVLALEALPLSSAVVRSSRNS